jgi:linoleoyl-CoA desaturase
MDSAVKIDLQKLWDQVVESVSTPQYNAFLTRTKPLGLLPGSAEEGSNLLLYLPIQALQYVQDFQKYFTGKIGDLPFRKMDLKEHIIFWITKLGYIAAFIVLPIFQVGVIDTIVGYLVASLVCGFVIAVVFQLAHVVKEAAFETPTSENHKVDAEWAVHQIQTTADFATKSKIVSWFTGGLNFQVEHHLFPRISHIHYPKINQFVKETCAQFGIDYIEFPTVMAAVRSHVVHLKQVGRV